MRPCGQTHDIGGVFTGVRGWKSIFTARKLVP
jgi:hypothetical protein